MKRFHFQIRCLLFTVLTLLHGSYSVNANSAMSPSVIKEVRKACVEVLVDRQLRGGGAIVEVGNGKAYVITAAHLFPRPNPHVTIMTEGYGNYHANLIAYDFGHDLALLEIQVPTSLPTIKVANYTPSPTQPVYNFGPALRRRTLIISGDVADSRVNYTDFEPSDGYLAHIFIAAISPELTSGGIWVNQKGEIIGIQSGRLKGDQGAPSSGLSMACPPRAIAKLVKTKKTESTPGIGGWIWELWTVNPELLQLVPENIKGLAVRWVKDGGAMKKAGIRANEIITACDGKPVTRRSELFRYIRDKPAGSTFSISVFSPTTKRMRTEKLKTQPLELRWDLILQGLRKGKG